MAKKQKHLRFVKGFLVGSLTIATAGYGALHAFKKKVIEPETEENDRVEANRRLLRLARLRFSSTLLSNSSCGSMIAFLNANTEPATAPKVVKLPIKNPFAKCFAIEMTSFEFPHMR